MASSDFNPNDLILGEFRRTLDDRFRLSIPPELVEPLTVAGTSCVLAKERPGSLSLWNEHAWGDRLEKSIAVVRAKVAAGRFDDRVGEIQSLGRLLSTRHKEVQVQNRGRLLIPEGFREFLGVEPGGDVLVVGAALCVEIWHPERWIAFLNEEISEFDQLLERLAK
ncbi:MAG: division/cell wall cluster transcriptional repressor MraZ [Planctomycetales bacterium]|nr:division/cell wall cluster transcriptional repressor MraZ [Planctomycetales bacterium]